MDPLDDAPETAEERAALDALGSDPRRILAAARLRAGPGAMRLRRRGPVLGAAAIAVAAGVAVVFALQPRQPAEVLAALQSGSRPLEVAFSDVPYAPYAPKRGPGDEARFDAALRKLLEAREKGEPGADRSLAMLYLLRSGPGDAARAEHVIRGTSAADENDRGVLAFAGGDEVAALDHFARAPDLAAARFNRALVLQRLGLRQRAVQAFETLAGEATPWSAEARQRAQMSGIFQPPPPASRREVLISLLAASTPAQLTAVKTQEPDLLALARKLSQLTAGQLEEHARLYGVYASLRKRAVAGAADVKEVEDFARFVTLDPVLWAPALQLAAYVHAARGEWRAAQRYHASIASGCSVRGCALENEAIALDELADAAGRDGDFETARRLQARAEAILTRAGAALQLAELHRKRGGLLLEEKRLDEAARSAALAVSELGDLDKSALAAALQQAADIAAARGQKAAASELSEAAFELARAAGNRDLEVDAAASLARNSAQLSRLQAEILRLEDAGHRTSAASLRATLAELLLAQGDKVRARAEAERGLAAAEAGAWSSDKVRLLLAHARAGGDAAEMSGAIAEAARSAAGASDPFALLDTARDVAVELVRASKDRPAEELLLPMDRLRAAAVGAQPAAPGWSRRLPARTCVVGQLAEVRVVVSPDGQLDQCEEVWIFSDQPLELSGPFAVGMATSLTRLLAQEPAPPRSALLVSSPSLPGMNREKEALRAMGAAVLELPGARAVPESVLDLAKSQPLLHFAVHGVEGGFLQLAGEGGRLAAREVAKMRLQPGARVVLSACHAGAPGPRGLAFAFARAGAVAVAAARDEVDDAAAARWSEKFYAALGRGLSFVRANREAQSEARFIVVK